MRFASVIAGLALLLVALPATAQQTRLADGSILLPYEEDAAPIVPAYQQMLSQQDAWRAFEAATEAPWMVLWNEATRTPQRALGVARIAGHPSVSAQTAEAAARAFVGQHAEVFRVSPDALELVKLVDAGDRFFVGFRQQHGAMPVAFSEVELVLFANGNVPMFGAVVYDDIPSMREAVGTAQAAQSAAVADLAFDAARDVVESDETVYVLPIREGRTVTYRPAYEVWVQTSEPVGFFQAYVDAVDGTVHYRNNLALSINPDDSATHQHAGHDHSAEASSALASQLADALLPSRNAVEGTVTGGTYEINPFGETEQQRPFARQRINVGTETVTADRDGQFSANVNGEQAVTATLSGANFTVNRENGPNASFTGTAEDGTPLSIQWDNSNSAANERNGYYHAMVNRLYLEDLYEQFAGPGQAFDYLNFLMPVNVGLAGSCNAFWNGSSISFYRAGGACPDIALLASVVYHEYGHGVNQWLYNKLGSGSMGNRAANEATADVMSNVIEDDPRVGRGFTGGTSVLRNCQNNVTMANFNPGTGLGADYDNSRILCGAFWRTRQAVDLDTYRYLAHFSKYSTPDDPNTIVAFAEWFAAVLVADDDDGDLTNGTPNYDAIVGAFNHHGIGINLLLSASLAHTPIPDQETADIDVPVVIDVSPLAVAGGTVEVTYSFDNFETEMTVTASADPDQSGRFVATLPSLPLGAVVRYYIRATTSGEVEAFLPADAPEASYSFLVGYERELFDPMEGPTSDWTAGAPDDTATQGIWERGAPQQLNFGSEVVQPPFDHTPGLANTQAWITGREAGSSVFANTVRTGKTTLFSPIYDASSTDFAVFRFYLWYFNSPEADPFEISLSNDGGETWTVVYDSPRKTDGWARIDIVGHDVMPLTDQMQLRFVAQNVTSSLSIVNALVDDFELLFAGTTVSSEQDGEAVAFGLDALYPNPTTGASTLGFSLPTAETVSVEVYDLLGRRVATAAEGAFAAGRHTIALATEGLAGGTYLVRLRAGQHVETTRLTVVR